MIKDMQPGRYRTRGGLVAIVNCSDDADPPGFWSGRVGDEWEVWESNGRYSGILKESPLDLVARLPDDPDGRIERALELIQSVQTYHHFEGGWDGGGVLLPAKANDGDWVEADIVKQLRKILEGTEQ